MVAISREVDSCGRDLKNIQGIRGTLCMKLSTLLSELLVTLSQPLERGFGYS